MFALRCDKGTAFGTAEDDDGRFSSIGFFGMDGEGVAEFLAPVCSSFLGSLPGIERTVVKGFHLWDWKVLFGLCIVEW